MRLIDLDALMKYPIRLDHCDKEHGDMHFVYGIESVLEYAEYLPIIDAVPVVRCKDCAKREYCRTSTVWAVVPSDDWFCADAERKEE